MSEETIEILSSMAEGRLLEIKDEWLASLKGFISKRGNVSNKSKRVLLDNAVEFSELLYGMLKGSSYIEDTANLLQESITLLNKAIGFASGSLRTQLIRCKKYAEKYLKKFDIPIYKPQYEPKYPKYPKTSTEYYNQLIQEEINKAKQRLPYDPKHVREIAKENIMKVAMTGNPKYVDYFTPSERTQHFLSVWDKHRAHQRQEREEMLNKADIEYMKSHPNEFTETTKKVLHIQELRRKNKIRNASKLLVKVLSSSRSA